MKIIDIKRACKDKNLRKNMILKKNISNNTKTISKHNLMLKCVIAP